MPPNQNPSPNQQPSPPAPQLSQPPSALATDNTPSNVTQVSGQIDSTNSDPTPITGSGLAAQARKQQGRKLLMILAACIAVVILALGSGFLYWYANQDHSIYSKLTTETYSKNGFNISFSYPAIMTTPYKNSAVLVAYSYNVTSSEKAIVGISYLPFGNALRNANITPTEVLTQIRTKSGPFVNAINHSSPNNFKDIYGNCGGTVKTIAGQTDDLCTGSLPNSSDFTEGRVIGEDSNNQYILTMVMPTTIWTAHQKVWQKVEKSFSY